MINLFRVILNKLIPNIDDRRALKAEIKSKFPFLIKDKKMKLGVSYSVWDGEELLEASIKSIRENSDYINVVWQRKSWFGEPCDENLESLLLSLKEKGLIDECIEFVPDFNIKPVDNEFSKRSLGLKYVQKARCTHFLIMDTDEFYRPEDFKNAKEYILKHNITHSFCNQYLYPSINYRESIAAGFYAVFIHKISIFSKLVKDAYSPFPFFVDPTKQIPIRLGSKCCFLNNIVMHHFGGVRKDARRKFRNSAANLTLKDQENLVSWTESASDDKQKNKKLVFEENVFNITLE